VGGGGSRLAEGLIGSAKSGFGKKKISFSPSQIPLSCLSPGCGSLPKSSAQPKGWEEARENEEVKKYPWAGRREELCPIGTNTRAGFAGITKTVNVKFR